MVREVDSCFCEALYVQIGICQIQNERKNYTEWHSILIIFSIASWPHCPLMLGHFFQSPQQDLFFLKVYFSQSLLENNQFRHRKRFMVRKFYLRLKCKIGWLVQWTFETGQANTVRIKVLELLDFFLSHLKCTLMHWYIAKGEMRWQCVLHFEWCMLQRPLRVIH